MDSPSEVMSTTFLLSLRNRHTLNYGGSIFLSICKSMEFGHAKLGHQKIKTSTSRGRKCTHAHFEDGLIKSIA